MPRNSVYFKGKEPVFCAFGANLFSTAGVCEETFSAICGEFLHAGISIAKKSRLFRTPCYPKGVGPDYLNAVLQLETRLPPIDLLAFFHTLEAKYGRVRKARWAGRPLDLDLLAYGDLIAPDLAGFKAWKDLPLEAQLTQAPEQLILPHPRLQDRGFVLIPFADIAPDWCHPVTGETVQNMIKQLPESQKQQIEPI